MTRRTQRKCLISGCRCVVYRGHKFCLGHMLNATVEQKLEAIREKNQVLSQTFSYPKPYPSGETSETVRLL